VPNFNPTQSVQHVTVWPWGEKSPNRPLSNRTIGSLRFAHAAAIGINFLVIVGDSWRARAYKRTGVWGGAPSGFRAEPLVRGLSPLKLKTFQLRRRGNEEQIYSTLNFDRTYLCNGTWYQQSERNFSIYRDSPTFPKIGTCRRVHNYYDPQAAI